MCHLRRMCVGTMGTYSRYALSGCPIHKSHDGSTFGLLHLGMLDKICVHKYVIVEPYTFLWH